MMSTRWQGRASLIQETANDEGRSQAGDAKGNANGTKGILQFACSTVEAGRAIIG